MIYTGFNGVSWHICYTNHFEFRDIAMRKVEIDGLPPMKPKEMAYVIEYTKDFSPARAAERAGYTTSMGATLRDRPHIHEAIEMVLARRLETSQIDAEWVLLELADNHLLARQAGELGASNRALAEMNKHKLVDGLASAKTDVNISGGDMVSRIRRGRDRLAAESLYADAEKPVSFL